MVVGARAAQLDQVGLEDALFEGNGGQGAQGGGGEIDGQQILHQFRQTGAELEAVARPFLVDFQGGIPVGVIRHQGDQG